VKEKEDRAKLPLVTDGEIECYLGKDAAAQSGDNLRRICTELMREANERVRAASNTKEAKAVVGRETLTNYTGAVVDKYKELCSLDKERIKKLKSTDHFLMFYLGHFLVCLILLVTKFV
jgi:hypothetical protein